MKISSRDGVVSLDLPTSSSQKLGPAFTELASSASFQSKNSRNLNAVYLRNIEPF
jgi:hypothetical protein